MATDVPRYVRRGVCPECLRVYVLLKTGMIRQHKRWDYSMYRLVPCEGSGQEPRYGDA